MNMLEAFKKLDCLNEGKIDEFKTALDEIAQLESEIEELERLKTQGWKEGEYPKRLEKAAEELNKLKQDLRDLKNSYREFWYMERDYDDDRYYDWPVYKDDPDKKAAVAEEEARLETLLKELETKYAEIEAQIKAEYEKDFAEHIKALADKAAALRTKQATKTDTLNSIIAEERPELEKLLAKISNIVTPDWKNVSYDKKQNRLYLGLISVPNTCDVDYNDIEFDSDEPYIDSSALEQTIQEEADEIFIDVASGLGVDSDVLDALDNIAKAEGELLTIAESTWKLEVGVELDYKEPEVHSYEDTSDYSWDGWGSSMEIDYDEYVDWTAKFYLVKEI